MKLIHNIGVLIFLTTGINIAFAQMDHEHEHEHEHEHHAATTSDFKVTANTSQPLKENVSTSVTLFLTKNNQGVGESQLKTVHTEKVHGLIIDPTFTDYQHVHPIPGKKTGEYLFDFTPRTANNYHIWLDITPDNGTQQYVMTNIPGAHKQNPPINKTLNMSSTIDGYHFNLSFDKKTLKAGQDVIGSVMILDKNNQPVKNLEPIMEAFAHIVAFNEDYKTILHVHPMGPEPTDLAQRGGPKIDFHLTPSSSGFVKIFVQVQIDGKEVMAPFGINVN